MSPKSINKALDLIGEDYDLKLHEWKDSIASHMVQKKEAVEEKWRLELRKEELNELLLRDDVHNQLNQIQAATSDVDQKILQIQEECPSSFNIALDNNDLKVLASDMTSDNQNKDYHWCNHNGHLDRVNPLQLENGVPTVNLEALPNITFLPSLDDQNSLLSDFVVLVGRVTVLCKSNASKMHEFRCLFTLTFRESSRESLSDNSRPFERNFPRRKNAVSWNFKYETKFHDDKRCFTSLVLEILH